MRTITCNACNAGFDDEEQLRLHYRSEWHRYNLKRKVDGVPGVTEALFLARQAALAEGSKPASTPIHELHLNSPSHLLKASQEPNASIGGVTVVEPLLERVPRRAPSAVEEDEDDEEEEEWFEVDSNDMELADESTSNTQEDEQSSKSDDDMADLEELDVSSCFMCDVKHDTIQDCMVHMHKKHGFFIPDSEYLKDPSALLTYVGLKVKRDFICLYCNDRCQPFFSLEAVRKHMDAKGHCKLRYGDDEDADLEDFYDYSSREVTIEEKSGYTSSGPYVCADLLDSLLHEIIVLINSFQDFLAFTGTCQSWRAAVSSFPSMYAFSFPPLHLEQDGPYSSGMKPLTLSLSDCKWKLSDITKKNLSLRCSVAENTPNEMRYFGCSHGYLIFTYEEHCLLVDTYTGTKVMPPKLPRNNKLRYWSGIGILTTPFSSPDSRLLLFSLASMFEWQVGTKSWSEHPLDLEYERIYQVLSFKGHILVIDVKLRLHTIQLTPQFSMKEVGGTLRYMGKSPCAPWLVVCGDMLLMVNLAVAFPSPMCSDTMRFFEVFRLDFSVEPAKWVQMEKLENRALFLSLDRRNPSFCCVNPERWGGKSNCVYVAKLYKNADPEETWTVLEVGQSVPHRRIVDTIGWPLDYSQIGSLWLFPSLVYGATQ